MSLSILHDGPAQLGRYEGLLLQVNYSLLPLMLVLFAIGVLGGVLLWRWFEAPRYRRGRS